MNITITKTQRLYILCIGIALISLFPQAILAWGYDWYGFHGTFNNNGVVYRAPSENATTCTVIRANDSDIVIPEIAKRIEDDGSTYYYTVTGISNGAFFNNYELKTVRIEAPITEIEDEVFYGCTRLKTVILPSSISKIGRRAFRDCKNLTNITLPKSLKTIEEYAFVNCKSISELQFPESLNYMGEGAFQSSGIVKVKLPDNLTELGSYCFASCQMLKKVLLGENLSRIKPYTFGWCTALDSVQMRDKVRVIEEYSFYNCSALKKIDLSAQLDSIGVYAFFCCYALPQIRLPQQLSYIGENAFMHCRGIENLRIPASVKFIAREAFYDTSFVDLVIDPSVDPLEIQEYVLDAPIESLFLGRNIILSPRFPSQPQYWETLTSVTIGDLVTEITPIFANCTKLKEIEIPANVKYIRNSSFYRCGLTSVDIPESITEIAKSAFNGCMLESVKLPTSIIKIDDDAFCDNPLKSVVLPSALETIGARAFSYCSDLVSITSLNPIPPVCTPSGTWGIDNSFHHVDQYRCRVYVPEGSIEAYRAAEVWKDFYNILPLEDNWINDASIDNAGIRLEGRQLISTADKNHISIYNCSGVLIDEAILDAQESIMMPEGFFIVISPFGSSKIIVK